MQIEKVKISQVKNNPNNPRVIKNDDFRKLVKSIKEAPWMLQLRSIIVNDDNVVLGGNQRLRACKEAGLKEVYIIKASSLTEEQQREFIVKDNLSSGEWDWDALANEFEIEDLENWGLNLPLGYDEIKDTKDIPDTGEIEFSEELFLEHNYIVLYFDNALDWEVAQEKYNIKKVKTPVTEKSQKVGTGRVINGKDYL